MNLKKNITFWLTLIGLIGLVYLPFMNSRVIRTAGDDKVYVSQALEMSQTGNWFLQTYADQPNYFKGPFHYISIRLGILVFGKTMLATVYMNFLLLCLGGIALAAVFRKLYPDRLDIALWTGLSFPFAIDLYAHAWASQMEAELAGLFAIASYFLIQTLDLQSKSKKFLYFFWALCGLIGWVKSPLHSVLLGTSALLFWILEGSILARLKQPSFYISILIGVILSASGYLPAFILDHDAFFSAYIQRETLFKPSNGGPWYQALVPIFTYSILPWTFVFWTGLLSVLQLKTKKINPSNEQNKLYLLALSLALPSVVFFVWHPYRGDNYNLPILSAFYIFMGASLVNDSFSIKKRFKWSFAISIFLLFTTSILLIVVYLRMKPLPDYFSLNAPFWMLLGAILSLYYFWQTFKQKRFLLHGMSIGLAVFLFGVGFILKNFGEWELKDLRETISKIEAKEGNAPNITYYNLTQNIWSEWGYLNFMIKKPVKGLHSKDTLKQAILDHSLILAREDWALDEIKAMAKELKVEQQIEVLPWMRWKRHGKNTEGKPVWKEAWDARSIEVLQSPFYIVRFKVKT